MSEVLIGGAISLAASVVTTFLVATLAYRHELRTRWDKDTLATVSRALVSTERAMGRIYAWSRGAIAAETDAHRPSAVSTDLDQAYYQLQELSVIFPSVEDAAVRLQSALVQLASLTDAVAGSGQLSEHYLGESESIREDIGRDLRGIRTAAQKRLAIS
jgi:hypothetical protein